ncbi:MULTISPECIES: DUF6932 family protein [Pseudomonadaceae]|uniref:Uncharacterized protein n=1 Tax=Ectopseudomonas toyotomiensis TaxID=554344 RepID=A0AA42IUB3_9GAMM|nr:MULTISPECIES: hypothetical protein [Pseudomonas]AQZ32059.1 hypothetical protein BHQ29_01345 [Pseudomonas sp. LPH1]MDH0702824.1 hypothetical protein [Pseudomonas toyotomiensis]
MIPEWNLSGVLPPIQPGEAGHSANRSPYRVALVEVVEVFSGSAHRISILQGLLDYRAALHALGIARGFQWLDGSFMEHVEVLESRPPRDMDVVTFFHLPANETQASLASKAAHLFIPEQTKAVYQLDAYPYILGRPTEPHHVKQISYWYSMWSHRRNGMWKGFVQVDLAPEEDQAARSILELVQGGGATS